MQANRHEKCALGNKKSQTSTKLLIEIIYLNDNDGMSNNIRFKIIHGQRLSKYG